MIASTQSNRLDYTRDSRIHGLNPARLQESQDQCLPGSESGLADCPQFLQMLQEQHALLMPSGGGWVAETVAQISTGP